MDEKLEKILLDSFQIYQDLGIKSVSIEDLCKRMHISKKTIYKFIKNKEDLISKIYLELFLKEISEEYSKVEETENAIHQIIENQNVYFFHTSQLSASVLYDLETFYTHIFHEMHESILDISKKHLQDNLLLGIEQEMYKSDINAHLFISIFNFLHSSAHQIESEFKSFEIKKELVEMYVSRIATSTGMRTYNSLIR